MGVTTPYNDNGTYWKNKFLVDRVILAPEKVASNKTPTNGTSVYRQKHTWYSLTMHVFRFVNDVEKQVSKVDNIFFQMA